MSVDKNLFLYDLAVVAIMKNEAPYAKEWIEYHLAAGVDHFFIYDNESPDNLKEVLQPYINAGIVTYKFYPGIQRQCEAYIEAYKAYRFFCRYMTFLDADEFIFPQNNKSIVEVADEIFQENPAIAGIEMNWMMYGSNNQEKADYSRGVLERFTRRAPEIVDIVKTIANPRLIKDIVKSHYMHYFCGSEPVNKEYLENTHAKYKLSDKIIVNHYRLKSREEFLRKSQNCNVDAFYGKPEYYDPNQFNHYEDNEVFDNSILAYFDVRKNKVAENLEKTIPYEKIVTTLIETLSPMFSGNEVPKEFFEGKMETFLTCRALSTYLKKNVLDESRGEIVEKASLRAIYSTMLTDVSFQDMALMLSELPNILPMNYPVVQDILKACLNIIPQIQSTIKSQIDDASKFLSWTEFNTYDNLYRLLKVFEHYEHK